MPRKSSQRPSTKLSQADPFAALQRRLGVTFKDQALLRQALVHRSYLNERPDLGWESYERLEFLGDAFLGWVVAEELFRRFPQFTEGQMTQARAWLVKGQTLAEIARGLDLGTHLYMGQGEEANGGRQRRRNLAAVLEAMLAAVLIDRGERAAKRLVLRWLGGYIDRLEAEEVPRDAKSRLQELVQAKGMALPAYELVNQSGPPNARRFEVAVLLDGKMLGLGVGRRKSDAEQAAAAEAMDVLAAE